MRPAAEAISVTQRPASGAAPGSVSCRGYAAKLIGFLGSLLAGLILTSPAANAVTYTLVAQEYQPGFMTGNVGPATAIVDTDGFVTGSFMVSAPFPPGDSCVAVGNLCQSITLIHDLSAGDFVLLAALPDGFFDNGFAFPLGSLAIPGVYASTTGFTATLTVSVPRPAGGYGGRPPSSETKGPR
jgi:hypothetical protein